jgi:4-alpha-glucanotransferase
LSEKEQCEVRDYLGSSGVYPAEDLVRAALGSVADTAIIPFQDLLGLPTAARMNVPGRADGNWEWRFTWDMIDKDLQQRFRHKLELFGRCR